MSWLELNGAVRLNRHRKGATVHDKKTKLGSI